MKTGKEIFSLIARCSDVRDLSKELPKPTLEKDGMYLRGDAILLTTEANEALMAYLWENQMRYYQGVQKSLPWRNLLDIPLLINVKKDGKWVIVKEDRAWLISKENQHERP